MTPLIEFQDVYKIYQMGETEVRAIDGISMTVQKNEFLAIVGQSGSGKSTCMNIIGCLDVPTSGKYFLDGKDVSTMNDDEQAEIRNKKLGFIFQQYNLISKLNVIENVKLPLLYAGLSEKEQEKRALHSLERVGLADKAKICLLSYPVVSSSVYPLLVHWQEILPLFSPMSQPVHWIPVPVGKFWHSSNNCTKREIPLYSSPTITPLHPRLREL